MLKFFSKEQLWKEIIRREMFSNSSEEVEATLIWRSVFHRTPEVSDYMKRRQINLLKSNALGEKPSQFVLGQISENMLWQRFDTVEHKKDEAIQKPEKKLIHVNEFLKKFAGMTNKLEE